MQLNPADSVMDLKQFLLDAPETCFYTCYDLLLHAKDGSVHQMEDYNEISEVADITSGGCSLEMVAGILMLYLFQRRKRFCHGILSVKLLVYGYLLFKIYLKPFLIEIRDTFFFQRYTTIDQ